MSIHTAFQKCFGFFGKTPVVVEPSAGALTSDAGLLPVREFDERIGLTQGLADALGDLRRQASVDHSYLEMTRSRVYGILADYPDQNDHDVLRFDPVFQLIGGRSPADEPLACQSTLSRFENAVDIPALYRLRDVLIDQFIASFEQPPTRLTLDVDTYDDPTHGAQQLTFFHGHYDQYQYQPRIVTCDENDLTVMVWLLHGTAAPTLGFDDDLRYLVGRLREAWPDVQLHLRGDSGFGVPLMYDVCEELRVDYSFGMGMNSVLRRETEELLARAVAQYEEQGTPQRLFDAFEYQTRSWPEARWTIIKCEANSQGTNRRAVVTNRPGGRVLPAACYDAYTDRGESENRNKELKCGLAADRLSDHRYLANFFRLFLHAGAFNLLARLRRSVASPPPEPPGEIPLEASAEPERSRNFNRRRVHDPLGEGQPATWRTRLIKVAAEVIVSSRRILVRLSSNWPYLHHFADISDAALGVPLPSG